MAFLYNNRVMVNMPDGSRVVFSLGKRKHDAERIRSHIDALEDAFKYNTRIPKDTLAWLESAPEKLRRRLLARGLAPKNAEDEALEKPVKRLGELVDEYTATRKGDKTSTLAHMKQPMANLIEKFGKDRDIATITEGDAEDWQRWMKSHKRFSQNTVRRRTASCKLLFKYAVKKRYIASNPFADLKCTVSGNHEKMYYVTREDIDRLNAKLPDDEWRAIVVLARFGGLRCPSEVFALKWADINWEHDRFRVRCVKTEHHNGRGYREVPLFPEVAEALLKLWEIAEEGAEYVIVKHRHHTNINKALCDIMGRCGLTRWPKLFQNMRATRATELRREGVSSDLVNGWIGHTEDVAERHYLTSTDDDFAKAAGRKLSLERSLQVGATTCNTVPVSPSDAMVCVGAQPVETNGPERTRTSDLALIRGAL